MNLEQVFIKTSQKSVLCLNSKEIQNKSLGENNKQMRLLQTASKTV